MPGAAGSRSRCTAGFYGLKDGLMRDLGLNVRRADDLMPRYAAALENLTAPGA